MGTPPTPSYAPSAAPRRASAPVASGPEVSAVVKRFDPERGFGFVAVEGGGGDAFLHISVLQRAGADTVAPGTKLRVRTGQGERGPQVTEVLEVGPVGEIPPSPPRGGMGAGPRPGPGGGGAGFRTPHPPGAGEEVQGTVKWYSAEKGFGFVTPSDGGKDVFVHATALERSGLRPLTEGQAVTLRVVQGKKGPEAASVTAS
ncbi:cold-shock protein [Falsiroseomonas tokyonensis]|uniref:Cold-shock protein n=1 Tax=Falsiroseomonas tokyonensis TaxID=430521 RepID=A0ABV7C241_9PROT|nr:cold-shock protein [Falsiroseomonas tokyonensis]MBU8541143.1 CspA family cold shock protein [Falsiroseomonas tokyonensis]